MKNKCYNTDTRFATYGRKELYMLEKIYNLIPLQLFGDGGDGGSSGEGNTASTSTGDTGDAARRAGGSEIPAFVPERAKANYRKAMEIVARRGNPEAAKAASTEPSEDKPDTEGKENDQKRLTYTELIKSPEYADEHKKYMEKTISERFGKYKGLQGRLDKAMEQLGVVGGKYGLDPSSETFFEDLQAKMNEDSEFFADYAAEHGIPPEEGRSIAQMKAKLARYDREAASRAEAEEAARQIAALRESANQTRGLYPTFNLDAEMENPRFRQLCATLKGDTTTAYRMTHYDELFNSAQKEASERARRELSASIASGHARPLENGLSKNVATPTTPDFSNMNSKQLREYYQSGKLGR